MRFAGDALSVLNHDNYGQRTVDGQQRLIEPVKPNSYPQVIDTPAHLTGNPGFDALDLKQTPELTPMQKPSNPFQHERDLNKFILHSPRSGVG